MFDWLRKKAVIKEEGDLWEVTQTADLWAIYGDLSKPADFKLLLVARQSDGHGGEWSAYHAFGSQFKVGDVIKYRDFKWWVKNEAGKWDKTDEIKHYTIPLHLITGTGIIKWDK